MKHVKNDALQILAKVCMEVNNGDVLRSFQDIKCIDDLLGIVKSKSLITHTRGRKSAREKSYNDIFHARLLAYHNEKVSNNG